MTISVKLPVFEGPLDLLLHLIDRDKINIYDIPIVEITHQYIEEVHRMQSMDMNVTSEFLVMAATLLDIKSRMLLPKEEEETEEEEDPRDELVRRLLEYRKYKYAAGELNDRSVLAQHFFFRERDLPAEVKAYQEPIDYEKLVGKNTAATLERILEEVIRRKKFRVDPVRSRFSTIEKEKISAADKELFIRAYLQEHPAADFRSLLEKQESRSEIIVVFLIILEMARKGLIEIRQSSICGEIEIYRKEALADGHE